MNNLISKASLARMTGISAAAITKKTKHGNLQDAMVGKRVDADHPNVVALISKHNGTFKAPDNDPPGPKPRPVSGNAALKQKRKSSEKPTIPASGLQLIPADIRKLAGKTLTQLVDIFGTDVRFVDWLKATKEVETIASLRIKNAKSLGELVSQDIIRQGVVMPVDTAFRELLTDGARTMAQRAHSKAACGATVDELEEMIQKMMSAYFKPMKLKIERVLRGLA